MENAIKALTMAASVLIAMVIIGAMLLVFNNLNNYQGVNEQIKKDEQVNEFNRQFNTYDRTDVRGSDVLSLINKVIDYNERQSYIGNEGADLGYKPIRLIINISKNKENMKVPNQDAGSLKLFTAFDDNYKIDINSSLNQMTNNFEGILEEVNKLENNNHINLNKDNYTQLAVGITSIFLNGSDLNNDTTKEKAIKTFKNITGHNITSYDSLKPGSDIRNAVYKYYEFIQFKRTYFDCVSLDSKSSGIIYDENTGRITEMYFVGNGRIE